MPNMFLLFVLSIDALQINTIFVLMIIYVDEKPKHGILVLINAYICLF